LFVCLFVCLCLCVQRVNNALLTLKFDPFRRLADAQDRYFGTDSSTDNSTTDSTVINCSEMKRCGAHRVPARACVRLRVVVWCQLLASHVHVTLMCWCVRTGNESS
jgi:hypothetical protein